MISMNNLGQNGRLGNQLFQYSFLFGLSQYMNYDFCLPNRSCSLSRCFELYNIKKQSTNYETYNERHFHYDKSFPLSYPDNINYSGYFQSENYFKKYKDKLLQSLVFKKQYQKKLDININYNRVVSIHVRRTDYLNDSSIYHILDLDYYNKAKQYFKNKIFLVFSDDISWCIENKLGDIYSYNNCSYSDLYAMSMCSSSIISNSTFSWWGAYLGKKKEHIIAPKLWFKTDYDTKDLYCDGWKII